MAGNDKGAAAGADEPYVSVFAKSAGFETTGQKFSRKMRENPLVPIGEASNHEERRREEGEQPADGGGA